MVIGSIGNALDHVVIGSIGNALDHEVIGSIEVLLIMW